MKVLQQLIKREFGLFWKNKVLVMDFLFMSVVLAAVVGFVYKKGKLTRQPIIVVDKDHSPASARFIDILSENQTLLVKETAFESVELAQLRLDKKAVAVVVIPYRFEENILLGAKPEINCYFNQSNNLKGNQVRAAIQLCTNSMNVATQTNYLERKGIPYPVAIQQYEAVHHNVFKQFDRTGNYLLFLWPGLIMSVLEQLLLIGTAVGFSQEFAGNHFNRNGLLGFTRSPYKLILVKIFPYLLMSLCILGIDYMLSRYFKIMPPAHPWTLLLVAILFVLSCCMLGTLLSIRSPLPLKATQTLMSIASPALTLCGFTWPSEHIPVVLRTIADIIPLKPFLKAMRLIWIDGASLDQVLPLIGHQFIQIVIYSLLSILLLRKKIKKADWPEEIQPVLAAV
ncbi:MAG TPA: ABC transporter permease [Chitinophagaceae bacterium]|nr:ABC transporter permease [Chitinophagaceae bacterium]